jgi:two-component system response regulator RegA
MRESARRILVCDDDAVFRRRLCRSLRDRGHSVYEAENAQHGVEVCIEYQPEWAIVDLRMPGESGLWLVSELSRVAPSCLVVVLTGFGSIVTALDAIKRGAVHYLTKPVSVAEIVAAFSADRAEQPRAHEMPSLAEVEAEYVQRVLRECGGNVTQSAKILGVDRRSLQRKLKQVVPREVR